MIKNLISNMEIIKVLLNSNGITIQLSLIGLFIILFFMVCLYLIRRKVFQRYRLEEAEIGWGGLKYKIKPSFEDLQVAYKFWVEISTRKLGIEIDKENDLIKKLHRSYYEFFKIAREVLKEIPAEKISDKETQKIIKLILAILNNEIRLYLTKWHARFENWYASNFEKYKDLSPVEIEQKFPQYTELMKDLLRLNEKIIGFRKSLGELIGIKGTD